MVRVALITGITGQDGSYLAELLLEKNYKVFGIIRRSSNINTHRIEHIFNKLILRYGDLIDSNNILNILNEIKTTTDNLEILEVYNLAAMSHVKISFDLPEYTGNIDGLGGSGLFIYFDSSFGRPVCGGSSGSTNGNYSDPSYNNTLYLYPYNYTGDTTNIGYPFPYAYGAGKLI